MSANTAVERMLRAALVLGLGAVAAGLFALFDEVQYRLVRLEGPGLVVLLLLGVVAIVGSRLARRPVVALAGAGLLAAAVLQFAQLGRAANWLKGDGSTASLFLGLGIGLLALGLTAVPADVAGDRTERETNAA